MTLNDGPIASPAPTYPIPVWGTPEASPTDPVAVLELPATGFGDSLNDPGIGWPSVIAVVLCVAIVAGYLWYARRQRGN
jgi:hypothetical protein